MPLVQLLYRAPLLSPNPPIPLSSAGNLISIASTHCQSIADSYPYGSISEMGMESLRPSLFKCAAAWICCLLQSVFGERAGVDG